MPHDNAAIDATGMYIPIRARFKHLLEMGLGYCIYSVGSVARPWYEWQFEGLETAGRVTIRLPAFLLPPDIAIWSQWL